MVGPPKVSPRPASQPDPDPAPQPIPVPLPRTQGTGGEVPSDTTRIGRKVVTFVVSPKGVGDDVGWLTFRRFDSTNHYGSVPRNSRHEKFNQVGPVKYWVSTD